MKLLRIGFGNTVVASRIKEIRAIKPSEWRKWRRYTEHSVKFIDATAGRHTRAILITDSGHIILSSISPEILEERRRELIA
jgi:hypothetical protein